MTKAARDFALVKILWRASLPRKPSEHSISTALKKAFSPFETKFFEG